MKRLLLEIEKGVPPWLEELTAIVFIIAGISMMLYGIIEAILKGGAS